MSLPPTDQKSSPESTKPVASENAIAPDEKNVSEVGADAAVKEEVCESSTATAPATSQATTSTSDKIPESETVVVTVPSPLLDEEPANVTAPTIAKADAASDKAPPAESPSNKATPESVAAIKVEQQDGSTEAKEESPSAATTTLENESPPA